MKQRLMSLNDRLMLRKRSIVESIIDQLKNICAPIAFSASFSSQLFCQHFGWIDCLLPPTEETVNRNRPQSLASGLTRTHVK